MASFLPFRPLSALRSLLTSEAAGGVALAAATVLALAVANSALAPAYFGALQTYVASLSVLHWINDGLMALFFSWSGWSSSGKCSTDSSALGNGASSPPPRRQAA